MFRIYVIVAATIFSWSGAEARREVAIPAAVQVAGGNEIHLGHLLPANFDDPATRQACAKMPLTDVPRTGEKRIITSQLVASVLRRAKATYPEVFAHYHFHIPQEIVVENSGVGLAESEIRQGLLSQWRAQCQECQFEIQELSLPRLPAEVVVTDWELVGVPSLPRGSFSVAIRVNHENQEADAKHRYWVNGVARVLKKVPVTQRSLNFDERLSEADIKFEFRDVTYARDAIPEAPMMIGRKVKMTKAAGQIVWLNDLVKEKAVTRGEWIKVSSVEGPLEISTLAQAETDGFVGDVVRLRSSTTKQLLSGVATAKGQVVLE